MPVVHLPSLGVFLPTLLAQHPCTSFFSSRATDYHYLGSKAFRKVRTGPGAPLGCTKPDAGGRQPHAPPRGLQQAVPPGRASCEQVALRWEPGLAAGREMGVRKMKIPGVPVSLLCLTLTPNTLLQFLQTPTAFFRFSKAFFLPSSSSAADPRTSFV